MDKKNTTQLIVDGVRYTRKRDGSIVKLDPHTGHPIPRIRLSKKERRILKQHQ